MPGVHHTPAYRPPPPAAAVPRFAGAAVLLELGLGLLGIFGVGNMYAGRIGQGIALLLSYWVVFWVNVALLFVAIGWFTMPLCWIGYMVAGPLLAAKAVEDHNAYSQAAGRYGAATKACQPRPLGLSDELGTLSVTGVRERCPPARPPADEGPDVPAPG